MQPFVREVLVGESYGVPGGMGAPRAALRAMQAGAVLVAIAAVTDRAFDLDRFFVPKEMALHLTALVAGLLAVGAFRRVGVGRVDALLVGYLLLSAASTYLADDRALAIRALAVSVSGVAIYWAARALGEVGLASALLRALALAIVVGCATALLQAYGVRTDFFSQNRAPGGTLGNRNFVAHLGAFGMPVVLLVALRARRSAAYALGAIGVMVVIASLVLTRSRAGWLALGCVLLVFLAAMLLSAPLRRHRRTWGRLAGVVVLVAAGVAGAVFLPNDLRWRSENPYLESVTGIVNYQEGSGAGRLVQYRRSMRMAADRPLLGVGPGNWSIRYPDYAARRDPSLSRSDRDATANPWPSSDWVAFVSERGFPAAALLALALVSMAASAFRGLIAARDEEEGLAAAALLATVLGTVVAGLFDAVLLLALPTLIVWGALGALRPARSAPVGPGRGRLGMALLIVLALAAGVGVAESVRRLARMDLLAARGAHPAAAARGWPA